MSATPRSPGASCRQRCVSRGARRPCAGIRRGRLGPDQAFVGALAPVVAVSRCSGRSGADDIGRRGRPRGLMPGGPRALGRGLARVRAVGGPPHRPAGAAAVGGSPGPTGLALAVLGPWGGHHIAGPGAGGGSAGLRPAGRGPISRISARSPARTRCPAPRRRQEHRACRGAVQEAYAGPQRAAARGRSWRQLGAGTARSTSRSVGRRDTPAASGQASAPFEQLGPKRKTPHRKPPALEQALDGGGRAQLGPGPRRPPAHDGGTRRGGLARGGPSPSTCVSGHGCPPIAGLSGSYHIASGGDRPDAALPRPAASHQARERLRAGRLVGQERTGSRSLHLSRAGRIRRRRSRLRRRRSPAHVLEIET